MQTSPCSWHLSGSFYWAMMYYFLEIANERNVHFSLILTCEEHRSAGTYFCLADVLSLPCVRRSFSRLMRSCFSSSSLSSRFFFSFSCSLTPSKLTDAEQTHGRRRANSRTPSKLMDTEHSWTPSKLTHMYKSNLGSRAYVSNHTTTRANFNFVDPQ